MSPNEQQGQYEEEKRAHAQQLSKSHGEHPQNELHGDLHPSWLKRKIIHVDMDCFFAAVEQGDDPTLKDQPVIVGGRQGRGVVCAASYEARKYGVHSAMPISRAEKLCPKGIYLPVRMERYKEVSLSIQSIFKEVTPLVQPLSLDEAFLDVTENSWNEPLATEVAKKIRARIKSETGLTASAGVAPNRFIAKIASDQNKPDGLTVIPPQKVSEFVAALPIRKIWGVGPVTEKKIVDLGAHHVKDLQAYPLEFLKKKFGSMGEQLHELCRGIDERPVKIPKGSKSIGRETTFREDSGDREFLVNTLKKLCEKTAQSLQRKNLASHSFTLKLKNSDFKVASKSCPLHGGSCDAETLWQTSIDLLDSVDEDFLPLRLIGISCSKLQIQESAPQPFEWLEGQEVEA
jgi:DNA polymerase-4